MATQYAYLLGFRTIIPTGNAGEFIIGFDLALADPDAPKAMVGSTSVQFTYGTSSNQTIWDAAIAFATSQGYTILDGGLFAPQFNAIPLAKDLTYLGSTILGADANATSVVTVAASDFLMISVRVVGMDVTSIAALRFNGDTGANYASRYLSAAGGLALLTNTETINTTSARLGHANYIAGRAPLVHVSNKTSQNKTGSLSYYQGGAAPGAVAGIVFGGFEWGNTAAQITSVQMLAVDAGSKLLAGSGFAVMGGNF